RFRTRNAIDPLRPILVELMFDHSENDIESEIWDGLMPNCLSELRHAAATIDGRKVKLPTFMLVVLVGDLNAHATFERLHVVSRPPISNARRSSGSWDDFC